MRGFGLLKIVVTALLLAGAGTRLCAQEQEERLSEAKREMNRQVSQDKAIRQSKKDLKESSYKGAVKKQVEYGHAAYSQEQYALALDRYLRAYEKEADSANLLSITFLMGQCQQRLNHPKAASQHYNKIWLQGERSASFLQAYLEALFAIGDYRKAGIVIEELDKQGVESAMLYTRKESLEKMQDAVDMQQMFGLLPEDVILDTAINTAFSEYGPTLVQGELYFSSSRPVEGQVLSDPRTGQGYSRLFSSRFDPVSKSWGTPTPVKGEVAGLRGNIGTFSYDSADNTGYFTWVSGKATGIFTVQRAGDEWVNRQQLLFNYKQGADDFLGKVAHPSISKDGRRLLFVYRDPASPETGTDIWYVEKVEKKPEPVTKKRKGRSSSAPAPTTSSRSKKKKQPEGDQYVTVNADWGVPVRLSDEVNSAGRESFPQWINDSMFVFSSDGHVGNGGMDLYLTTVDPKNPVQVRSVDIFPRPINSSYDDGAVLPDPEHGFIILASNRHTRWGKTDNIYHIDKFGLKHSVEGYVFALPAPDTVSATLAEAAPVAAGAKAPDSVQAADSTAFAVADSSLRTFAAIDSTALSVADSAAGLQAADSLRRTPATTASAATPVAVVSVKDTTLVERTKLYNYYVMVNNPESGFFESVSPDSNGRYFISYLDPGEYDLTAYSEGYKDTTIHLSLERNNLMLPILINHRQDFDVAKKMQPKPKKAAPKPKPAPKPAPAPVAAKKPAPKKEDPSPRDIIKNLDKTKRYIPTVNKRSVEDYHARVDDPLRRTKLTVVPPDVHCEVCGEKDVWRKKVGEEFYVKSGDDKALISLVNAQGQTTYVDLAPNSAYSIVVQSTGSDGKASLPSNVQKGDILRKVVTRDYILFECAPKLSELNDEQYINNLYFDFDESGLIKDAPRELDRLIIVAIKNPQMYFQIETNADERGSEAYNKALTDRRLASVKSYVEKKGLDMSRVIGRSLGKSNPLVKGARTDEEHRLNRRAVVNLINTQAKNIKTGDATYPAPEVNPLNSGEVTFMVQLGAFRTPLENPLSYYGDVVANNPDLTITYYMDKDGYYKYNTGGIFTKIEDARALVVKLLNQKRECYISAFYKGQRITVSEALVILKHNKGGK